MKNYVKSDPHFFRLVSRAFVTIVILVLTSAAFIPAPLQGPADPARVPNPVRSAWFLLWIQELVSHGNYLIYLVLTLVLIILFLPWLQRQEGRNAHWFPSGQLPVNVGTLFVFLLVVALTVIAGCFRGENWSFVQF